MAKGRKKTPTAQLKIIGSRHARGRKAEPKVVAGCPDIPSWLSVDAKGLWPSVAKELNAAKVLTKSDALALGQLCESMAIFNAAQQEVLDKGKYATYKFVLGDQVKRVNPALKIMQDAQSNIYRWAREFGMTPSSRAGVAPVGEGNKKSKASSHFGKSG